MFNISNFLGKFSKNLSDAEENKEKIIEIVNKVIGIIIPKENIEIKNYIVYINCSSSIKNKIYIEKNKILEEIFSLVPFKIIDIK